MLEFILKYLTIQDIIWAVVLFPLATSAANWLASIAFPRKTAVSTFFGIVGPLASFAAAMLVFWTLTGIEGSEPSAITGAAYRWVGFSGWGVDVGLKVDQLSLVMALVVSGVGSLIHIYSSGYMYGDSGYARYFAELNLFLFFMLVLVLADNLILMFVGWEGVGLCSYLLIGFWFEDTEKIKAGTKAFVVNRIGDAGFLVGIFLIWSATAGQEIVGANPFNFDVLSRNVAFLVPVATPICLALFFGAAGKSAQIPLYVWLPDAMAGPTPVSALIHAATMVTAGVYMVARLNFIFVFSPAAMDVVACVGAATAVFAAIIGLAQRDIKKVLAYSTISQLGYMFMAEGVGAFGAGIFHLVTHSFFKAALFLGAGSVIHALHGEQDMFKMGGLKKYLPGTFAVFFAAAVANCGIWPFAGFYSKDGILWEVYSRGHTGLWLVGFITSGITAFYLFRAVSLVFFGGAKVSGDAPKIEESSVSMLAPLVFLGLLSFAGGWLKNSADDFLAPLFASAVFTKIGTHKSMEHILAAVSALWAAHWAFVAWVIYVQRPSWPGALAVKFRRTHKIIFNKFYGDEIYDFLIVKPVLFFSEKVLWRGIDAPLIDELGVNGSARAVGLLGRLVSVAQTGLTPHYLFFMALGLAVIIVGCL